MKDEHLGCTLQEVRHYAMAQLPPGPLGKEAPAMLTSNCDSRQIDGLDIRCYLPKPDDDVTGVTKERLPANEHWVKNGENRFTREVLPLTNDLVGRARGLTRQRADAEDLVQETLLKAYVSFASYREGSNLRAWLHRIMVNAWVDCHRATERRPREFLLADVTDQQATEHEPWGRQAPPSAEGEALDALPSRTDQAMRTLPEDVRIAVFYADLQGYPNVEIAEMLDIPVGTVGSRLHRGRTRLRELLQYPDDGQDGTTWWAEEAKSA